MTTYSGKVFGRSSEWKIESESR